ncbi:MAG: CehA/McbA family metallohydrolase [Burkholderiales bacterium]|nr:CehA/McbA family metallohydrolase [Burkholderiales bacterium]
MSQAAAVHPSVKYPDHHEFETELQVPFVSELASGARRFSVVMNYLGAPEGEQFAYTLELVAPDGKTVQSYAGIERFKGKPLTLNFDWAGRTSKAALADGVYEARLTAFAVDAGVAAEGDSDAARVQSLMATDDHGHAPHVESFKFVMGAAPAVKMPAYRAMALGSQLSGGEVPRAKAMSASAIASWPYTVYYGSLHGQTNDSDGGGDLATCNESQPAQTGKYGPDTAFPYAKGRGLDFFGNTDHNHYFDGSSGLGTIPAATAKNRYTAGLATAASYTAANPGFLAMYGMEWGVISGGGHLNIFNSDELYSWEYDPSNQLYGHRFVAKNDYATLYSVMRAAGQVGQFNHPDASGQFIVNGTDFGYTADGDEVMVLAEVSNTSAFSNKDDETQQPGSGYENAFKKILERGFHVAPATNQDNHCANWGASYTNRTAILVPTGTPLTKDSFVEALRARRVFATHDKNSQLVFSANGAIMGSRINSQGALNLNVGFANTAGKTVSLVEIWEGVPGRNGAMTVLTNSATYGFTPADGLHVYYAKVTQSDGKILWSAPIWVNQGAANNGDTTPPTVSVSETGNSGNITLSATASDNVGVTKVEFWVDGALKGTDTTAPYSMTLDSRTLPNGSHSVVAKAFDAGANSASSTPVTFSIANVNAGASETESNNTIATANAVGTATTVTGFISSTSDKDYFRIDLPANKKIRVDMTGPSGVDYDLYLVTSAGAGLASSEGTTASESLTYTNGASARTVYIKVQSYSGFSTTSGYTLTISYP